MAELQDRWEAIKEDDTAQVAQRIIGSSDPNTEYLEAIQGKTAEQILALQISIYAYHPEGNNASFENWEAASIEDFETFRDSNATFAAITAEPEVAEAEADADVDADADAEAATPTLAKDVYDATVQNPTEAAAGEDVDAMPWAQFIEAFSKFDSATGTFTGEVTEAEARAVAMAMALHDLNEAGDGWVKIPEYDAMTQAEMESHAEYTQVMDAFTALESAPTPNVTVRAPATDGHAFGLIIENIDDAAALTTYLEANGAELDAQIKDMLYGDAAADGISMDEASAAMDKINTQLEAVEAGSMEETVLRRAQEVINQDWDLAYMAENEAEAADPDAEVDPDAAAARVEPAAGVEGVAEVDPIRDVQRFALFARDGGYGELNQLIRSSDTEPGQISTIDGIPGVRTATSMSIMLSKNFSQLNAMTTEQAVTELEEKLQTDEALRASVVAGLRAAVGTEAEPEARAFLEARGVELTGDLTADIDTYVATLPAIEAEAAADADADVTLADGASISITSPAENTNAFDVTIAGIETTEQLEAYLATEGERIDTEMRAAMYNDITVVNTEDGISAEEAATVSGWIDAQLEGASEVETALLERARGLVEADAAAATADADADIVVQGPNATLTDDDRVIDGNILRDAQAAVARTVARGADIPENGILTVLEGHAMLIRDVEGEMVVTQLNQDNIDELTEGYVIDPQVRQNVLDDAAEYNMEHGRLPSSANDGRLTFQVDRETGTIDFGQRPRVGRAVEGLKTTFVNETGEGEYDSVLENEELGDALGAYDSKNEIGRVLTDASASVREEFAVRVERLQDAVEHGQAGHLSVEFKSGADGDVAEIEFGADGEFSRIEIPKALYDAIMEQATVESTRDNSFAVEVTPPTAGVGA